MVNDVTMPITVVYATGSDTGEQLLFNVEVEDGCTVADAMCQAVQVEGFSVLLTQVGVGQVDELLRFPMGVFGRRVKPDTVLQPYDRVEIYRPLQIDPKQARRLRAASKKSHRETPETG